MFSVPFNYRWIIKGYSTQVRADRTFFAQRQCHYSPSRAIEQQEEKAFYQDIPNASPGTPFPHVYPPMGRKELE